MGIETGILAAVGIGLGAVGQGVAYYGQQQAARTQQQFALLNSQSQVTQSAIQARLATSQAALQAQQARNQQQSAAVQAAAARDQAGQVAKVAQVNVGRQMEMQARIRSLIRAKQGATGLQAGVGSQLDILEESARLAALENSESIYQANVARRQLYRQAEGAQIGADYASIQSGIELMQGEARASAAKVAGYQAQMSGLAGVDAARGASLTALGGAIGGFGNLAFQAFDLNRLGAFRFNN